MRHECDCGRDRIIPVPATDYIGHAPDVLCRRDPVVLYCRVSTRAQRDQGHLGRQVADMRRQAREMNLVVVGEVATVMPGWHRDRLGDAVTLALRHGASILAHTADRLIRSADWWPDQKTLPGRLDFARLVAIAEGVPLVTVVHPDADAGDVRAAHTIRGQQVSGHRGGRPRKTRPGEKKGRRLVLLPKVVAFAQDGIGVREIARRTGLPVMTVSDWSNKGVYGFRRDAERPEPVLPRNPTGRWG